MTGGAGSGARCRPAKRMFPEKGCGARKPESLEFWVATWRASKNQWGGNQSPMIRPLKTHHDYFTYRSFPMAHWEIGGGRVKRGQIPAEEGRTTKSWTGSQKLNSSAVSYKCVYKMSAQRSGAPVGSVQTAGWITSKSPHWKPAWWQCYKMWLLFSMPEGRMKERTAIEDKSGSAALGRGFKLCCPGRSYLDKMAVSAWWQPLGLCDQPSPHSLSENRWGQETQCGVVEQALQLPRQGLLAGPWESPNLSELVSFSSGVIVVLPAL